MSAQLDQLHVTGLSCCVRLCMYMRVRESALLLLLHMCVKSQKSGQLQMCMYVCMYVCVYARTCVHGCEHAMRAFSLSCVCIGYLVLLLTCFSC